MADHEIDFTNADRVTVTLGVAHITAAAHEGVRTDTVGIDLPAGTAVVWNDERGVLGEPDGEDWRARYIQLFRALTSHLHAHEGITEQLIAALAQVAELLPWAVIGATTMADADADPPFDPDAAADLLQRAHTFRPPGQQP